MEIEWDPDKAAVNLRKHGVDFADAVGVFEDLYALQREDPDAQGEQRFIVVGMDFLGRVLTCVYTYRDTRIRLIMARRATARERAMNEHDRDMEMRDEYDFNEATRGAVIPPAPGKTRITIRLDNDILDWFRVQVHRQGGGNYQTLMNHALRQYIQSREGQPEDETVKATLAVVLRELRSAFIHEEQLRRVIREELQRAS